MEKTQDFEHYFTDERLAPEKLARMQLVRKLAHEIYPGCEERVCYAQPGFFPVSDDPKVKINAQKMLFYVRANKDWLGIYGIPDFDFEKYADFGIKSGKGSLQVPYALDEVVLRELLAEIVSHNLVRHGLK